MPDLSSILHDSPVDDLKEALIPEGYWKAKVLNGKLYETNSEGQSLTDKNGDNYARAVIYFAALAPLQGVRDSDAEAYFAAGGADETMASYTKFIYRKGDIIRLTNTLRAIGASTTGRSLDKLLDELKDSGLEAHILVEHDEYQDVIRAAVSDIAAV